jgi:predicted negative regulator of RcsB-dependent stress response
MGLILLSIFSVFFYLDIVKKQKTEIANKFIKASINYNLKEEAHYTKEFKEIINSHDTTYAPLALFFLIDNKIVSSNKEINHLFDQVLNNANLEKEIKNLVIYKKALINADFQPENIMIEILKPVINSESFWKPHSLLLLGDYFLFKGERQKAKDFYSQILTSQKTNKNIFNQAQQRILKNYGE